MAGPYAHILVCDHARNLASLDGDLGALLDTHTCMLSLGAVSPDLPAIWDKVPFVGGENWSDRFHSINNTGAHKLASNLVSRRHSKRSAPCPSSRRGWRGWPGCSDTSDTWSRTW